MSTNPVDEAGFRAEIAATASRVLECLAAGKASTAWELKMRLKVSHTKLHMAVGMLLERGCVCVRPDRLTYEISPAVPCAESLQDVPSGTPAEAAQA